MTIPPELEGKILRHLEVEKWPVGTAAQQLGVHHSVVERVREQAGLPSVERRPRPSMLDPYLAFMHDTLKSYPRLCASRLFDMTKVRGYPGGPDHFRHRVALIRPRPPAEAYLRLRTLSGEQAQIDWAHFGKVRVGRAERPLVAFVVVLSWSRMIFLRFFYNLRMPSFLQGHVEAFRSFGGVPRVSLYDNLKSAVLERLGDAIRFHPSLLALSAHYRCEPRPVAPYRGNEKGRVERAIRFVRDSFFAARPFRDLDDLNVQAKTWCQGQAADRPCPEDRSLTVRQAFEQEQPRLLALPNQPFPSEERIEAKVGKTPYLRFDLNDYSIPHTLTRRTLVVLADEKTVRILSGNEVVASHPRSFDRGAQVEDPTHLAKLEKEKRQARRHRGLDRLSQAVPKASELLAQLAQRGSNLGNATAMLLKLLDQYGTAELKAAVAEALGNQSPHPNSVRHILERETRKRGLPPPIPVDLPDDPRVRNLSVKTHDLSLYDSLKEGPAHEPKETHQP
jgi:transposase